MCKDLIDTTTSDQRQRAVGLMDIVHSAALENASKGDVEALKKLLERRDVQHWVNKGNTEDGVTPLHLASINGHLGAVKLLLLSGADINSADNLGWTPFHRACVNDRLEVLKFLLSSGADVNRANKLGWTALHDSSFFGHLEVVKFLLSSGAFVDIIESLFGSSAVGKAFNEGHSSVVELFIAMELKGELCYQGGVYGGSLLHVVCKEKEVKVGLVKRLLESGLDAAKVDKYGKRPVDYVSDDKIKAEVSQLINSVTAKKEDAPAHVRKSLEMKNLGNESFRKGHYEMAVQHYSEAIRLDSSNTLFYNNRAQAYLKASQYLNAEADASHIINSGDQDGLVKAYYRRASARYGINTSESLQGALDDINHVLSFDPENASAASQKNKILSSIQSKNEEAKEQWDNIVAHERPERKDKGQLQQLEEENQRLKSEKTCQDSHIEHSVASLDSPDRPAEVLNASVIGASSLGSYSAPTKRGAADKTQLPPVPPLNTVGASSLSCFGGEKVRRQSNVSMGARVVQVQDVKLGEVIGRGAFGKVYKGECDFQDVAVKVFECGSDIPEEVAEKVRQEVQVMCQLSHPNIVRLYGLVESVDSPPMLVMEFGAGGSLYSYLRRREYTDRPWSHRLRIAFELSRGLAYLHKMNVVHRDIKSLNVILNRHGEAMWCDFGLSATKEHVLTTSATTSLTADQDQDQVAGTLRWLAPEQFSFKHRVPSRASDVWSLGMVFFEIASQQVPYAASSNRELIKDWIKEGEGEEIPEYCQANAPVLADMMRRCWLERSARPSAAVIAEELKAAL